MALDLPDVYLELLCCNGAAPTRYGDPYLPSVIAPETKVPLDPSKYDGTCEYWFEVTAHNNEDYAVSVSLVDTTGLVYATLTFPVGEGGSNWEFWTRRVAFTPPATAKTMAVMFHVPDYPTDPASFYPSARIRIRQTGATRSRVQWPMLAFGGTGWNAGSQFAPGCSTNVVTGGAYRTGFDNFSSPNDAYSLDCLPIWKFSTADLDPVSAVLFRALPGKIVPRFNAWMYQTNLVLPGTLTHVDTMLFYSDDGGVTKLPAIPGVTGGEHHLPVNPSDPYPWSFESDIDPTLFEVAGRSWWVAIDTLTSYIYTDLLLFVTPGASITSAKFIGYTATAPGSVNHDDLFYCGLEIEGDDENIEGLSIAVFDRDTDTMVPGSELSWAKHESFDWKQTAIDPGDLTDGHEYEVRCSSPSVTYSTSPWISEAQLYLDIDPITCFTSWQRVMKGSVYFGWSYPPGWGSVYSPWGLGCVSVLSRLQYHEVPNVQVYYQESNSAWVWPNDGYPYEDDPGLAYEYFALWNDGENDSSLQAGNNRVDSSILSWTLADFSNNGDHPRLLKRTAEITPDLVDNARYCSLQPDDEYWLVPNDGYLVCTICAEAQSAECVSVTAAIDSATLLVTGTGTGTNATLWRVIRTSDSVVMASGAGMSAAFSFIGAYDVTYQLQFYGSDLLWSTEGCTFLFEGIVPVPCTDLPCVTPLCVPVATIEQYQGSLTAVAGPTAGINLYPCTPQNPMPAADVNVTLVTTARIKQAVPIA